MSKNEQNNSVEFSFSYLALKLLGKNLYSNAWAALSELVANGLDADATEVYVYIDMRNKKQSSIEVFDNGLGMNLIEMQKNYSRIGRNRRLDQGLSDSVMGRKGIGKLAALYLTRKYFVLTKKKDEDLLTFAMNFDAAKEDKVDDTPKMTMESDVEYTNIRFKEFKSGTMIRMVNVDLTGYSDASIESLNRVLSEFFSIDNMDDRKVYCKVVQKREDEANNFTLITKYTPFKNMTKIMTFDDLTYSRIKAVCGGHEYSIPYTHIENKYYTQKTDVADVENIDEIISNVDGKEFNANITGWIGVHATIKNDEAKKNDEYFIKNNTYNPMKLRVYVRNKLAIEDLLPQVNNNQVFAKYIEGEIHFDLLDDNDLPDIATTNRQGMDENDVRIVHLTKKMREAVGKLISSRVDISDKMKADQKTIQDKKENIAKKQFSEKFDEISKKFSLENVSSYEKNEKLKFELLKNIKGEFTKDNYKIFFSHSRKNKKVIDFFFYLMLKLGVEHDEMFYTSRDDCPQISVGENIEKMCRESIKDANTAVFFYITKEFKTTDYCMFEGGAAWATREKIDFILTHNDFSKVPEYLKLNAGEYLFEINFDNRKRRKIDIFNGDDYNKIVDLINFMIKHINKGRELNQKKEISLLESVNFPDKVEFENGVRPQLNNMILKYWDIYLEQGVYQKAIDEGYLNNNSV